MTDHHDAGAIEPRPPSHNRWVVPIEPVAVELDEVGEHGVHVIERVGTAGMTGNLHALHRRQVLIDLETQRGELVFERPDVLRDIRLLTRDAFQLLHRNYPASPWARKTPYWYR